MSFNIISNLKQKMKIIKILIITTLALSMTGISIARPGGHRPPPRPHAPRHHHHYRHHHHHDWWIPATIFSSAVAVTAVANAASTRTETVYVKEPANTTIIYQTPQTTTTTVVETPKQKVTREEIKPDGTRVIYYD